MSLGPVMMDVEGLCLSDEESRTLQHPQVGGVILFARNYASPEQLAALVAAIHALRQPPLLVAVDQEGGRVQRFRDGFTRLPPVAQLGEAYDRDARQGLRLAQETGWLMAAELRAVGVDLSFAPVLDMDRGACPVIGDRALHRQPETVAQLARAYRKGMHEAGMAATGKHFPGHGAVREDSHLELPLDPRRFEDIAMEDLIPFERMAHYGIEGFMAAHVVYSAVDSHAAGFSPFWLRDVLRQRLGFQGAIFSDDLSMQAAAVEGDHPARARAALAAGCDMVLVCNAPQAAREVLAALAAYDEPAGHMRLARLHGRTAPDLAALRASARWQRAVSAVQACDAEPLLDMDL